jgi:hypothetical protein
MRFRLADQDQLLSACGRHKERHRGRSTWACRHVSKKRWVLRFCSPGYSPTPPGQAREAERPRARRPKLSIDPVWHQITREGRPIQVDAAPVPHSPPVGNAPRDAGQLPTTHRPRMGRTRRQARQPLLFDRTRGAAGEPHLAHSRQTPGSVNPGHSDRRGAGARLPLVEEPINSNFSFSRQIYEPAGRVSLPVLQPDLNDSGGRSCFTGMRSLVSHSRRT